MIKDPRKTSRVYLPQIDGQIEALEKLAGVFAISSATTMAAGDIPTSAAYPRLNRYAPVPRVLDLPPRVHNSPTPVPALVVEYS